MNKLYYGDNLSIMEGMAKYSVDLVYLDPPFKSQKNYNLLYKTLTGKPVPEQAEAFCDTWEMDAEKDRIARNMPVLMKQYGVEQYYVNFWRLWMQALRHTQPHLLAYLIYMVQRLLHMKVILKPTGSIYLHCDPAASHYIKVMMDGIFGHNNFRSEIIWKRTSAHSGAKRYGPIHDTILYYTVGDRYTWNPQYEPLPQSTLDDWYNNVEDGTGRRYNRADLTAPGVREGSSGLAWRDVDPNQTGRHWAIPGFAKGIVEGLDTLDALDALDAANRIHWPKRKGGKPMLKRYVEESKGVPMQDVWTDIKPLHNLSKKRLGYPTQKPMALLDRIIRSSTNEGDVVFDPFCGCGTTIYAAHEANREWIGCDIAILAVRLVEGQLKERYGLIEGEHYEEHGIPNSVASALALFQHDPFQFEHWAVGVRRRLPDQEDGRQGYRRTDLLRDEKGSRRHGPVREGRQYPPHRHTRPNRGAVR